MDGIKESGNMNQSRLDNYARTVQEILIEIKNLENEIEKLERMQLKRNSKKRVSRIGELRTRLNDLNKELLMAARKDPRTKRVQPIMSTLDRMV